MVQDPNSSVATLGQCTRPRGGGNVKLSHAQAELQACEAHLALKEQDLERVRVRAVIGGLQRRCKALVECGWMWGEKGKEALRALETSAQRQSKTR
jgi:multidrug resistance efflux pump